MIEMTPVLRDGALTLRWPDGHAAAFPHLWLRENCPSAFHPQTGERRFDLLSAPPDLAPAEVALRDGALALRWPDGHASSFALDWLRAHAPGAPPPDPATVAPAQWPARPQRADAPTADAAALLADDAALRDWLVALKRFGLSIVTGLADDAEAGIAVGRRIAHLRETNFGVDFDVVSKPDPNNLAYTADALPLHTDLPNQELPPGFQFLHCIANEAQGGGSQFLDGFAAAQALRDADPAAFDTLTGVAIPFRFHDGDTDLRRHAPVIALDRAGAVTEINWNAHIAGVFDMPADVLRRYYPAYRAFMALTRDPDRVMTLKLAAGEMAVFYNRRVLHGRAAFDPSTGFRRLRGHYIDRGDLDSRLRVLSRPDG